MAAIVLLVSELLKTKNTDLLAPAKYYSNSSASSKSFGVGCRVEERKRGTNGKRNLKSQDQEIGENLEDVKIAVDLIWP